VAGFLPYILLVMLPTLAVSLWAAWRVKSTYARWDQVDSGISMSALDFARYLLNQHGLNDVRVEQTPGRLTDHYDPRDRVLRVSTAVSRSLAAAAPRPAAGSAAANAGWNLPGGASNSAAAARTSLSVAAVAVIAHEVGHAVQDRQGDPAMRLRQMIVPVAQIGSGVAPWLILAGLFMRLFNLALIGLVFFAAAVVFTFVTLPVEFGASNRALSYVGTLGLVGERADGAHAVLRAAGWTYVAAALTAVLTFLYYLTLVSGSRR
jgi:Zn-dependent membrane protease YugP